MDDRPVFLVSILMFLLCVLVSLPLVTVKVQSQEIDIGVQVGDWVEYEHSPIEWTSTDPNAKPDNELVELNNTVWSKNIVTKIDYPWIFFESITQSENGLQETEFLQVDVNSGLGNGTLNFIPAELFSGDFVYPEPLDIDPAMLNETALRTCTRVKRLVNHLISTNNQIISDGLPQSIHVSVDYYWDRETGFLTERSGTFSNNTGNYQTSWTRSDKIVDTNLWSGQETEPPKAKAGSNQTAYRDSAVMFNANASSDNTGIISYHWIFGDGATGAGVKATHVYKETGTYTVILIVKDGSGNMAWDAITVTVVNLFPQEGFVIIITVFIIIVAVWVLRSRKKRKIKKRLLRVRLLAINCLARAIIKGAIV